MSGFMPGCNETAEEPFAVSWAGLWHQHVDCSCGSLSAQDPIVESYRSKVSASRNFVQLVALAENQNSPSAELHVIGSLEF